jgi:membrane protein DedA with SNARE-associated domain
VISAIDHGTYGDGKGVLMAQWIEEFIRNGGYWALAAITFVENIFTPIPSEVIIPLGGYLVEQGHLTFWGVVVAGTVGSYLGALVLFYLGKQLKRHRLEAWAEKFGTWILLTKGDVSSSFDWFDRHGGAAVFFCRLVPGLRSLISVPAGASNMSLGKFSLYTIVGSALWTMLLTGVGMWLGQQYQDTGEFLKWINHVVTGLIVISIISWFLKRRSEDRLDEGRS